MLTDLNHYRGRRAYELIRQLADPGCLVIENGGNSTLRLPGPVLIPDSSPDLQTIRGRYLSYVRSAPVLIHRSGLLPALAFMEKKGKAWNLVRLHILWHLKQWNQPVANQQSLRLDAAAVNNAGELFRALLTGNHRALQVATQESQRLLTWLKSFAEVDFKADHDAIEEED